MKKIISVLAMALLVIGAAQAQEQKQVKKMVVQLNDDQVVKYNTENVKDVTFEITTITVPTTIEEAKAMLVGYWKNNSGFFNLATDDENIEGLYFVITEDLKILFCYKFKDSVTDEDYAPCAGKYVEWGFGDFDHGEITFTSEDPITFNFFSNMFDTLDDSSCVGTDLQEDSFVITIDIPNMEYSETATIERVEPFEFTKWEDLWGDDDMSKRKPAL